MNKIYRTEDIIEQFKKILKRDQRDGLSLVAYEWIFATSTINAHDEVSREGHRPYDAWKYYVSTLGYTLKEEIPIELEHGLKGKIIVYTNDKNEMGLDPFAAALGYLKSDNERVIVEVTFPDSFYKQTRTHKLN